MAIMRWSKERQWSKEKRNKEQLSPEVSLNSVMGITSPKTLKMLGVIQGQEVVIMVDPWATHNFISTDLVDKLQLPLTHTKAFAVSLGTGEAVQGREECKGVVIEVQGITVMEDFLPLQLGNSDLILGIQWLEKLGRMTTNWKTQKFQVGPDSVTLKGNSSLGRSRISLKAMLKVLTKEKQGLLVECNLMDSQFLEGEAKEAVGEVADFLQHEVSRF